MINKEELTYPKHKHPHGVENLPENEYRIWVCEECRHIFTDNEAREGLNGWGHPCKSHPCRKGQRCESHLEPYIPELPALLSKEEEAIRADERKKMRMRLENCYAKSSVESGRRVQALIEALKESNSKGE